MRHASWRFLQIQDALDEDQYTVDGQADSVDRKLPSGRGRSMTDRILFVFLIFLQNVFWCVVLILLLNESWLFWNSRLSFAVRSYTCPFLNLQISRWIPQITPPVRRFGCKSTRKSKNWMNERGNSGSVRWAEVVSNVGVSLEGLVTSESQVV